ncbi:hypothetical protein [Segnochrobactrum spirostomi]|uniref:Uncharacterized protein n=1 Tax=Segnochrobactrum spirostomi TaxID=2608987 RepID=A0A6A7Y1W3_9HYPH|nr:hypothetical protein [Segnochrobactrum spirostomi]MQT12973.1 hypothetical protein [Segnochrobactrum spirostomi]
MPLDFDAFCTSLGEAAPPTGLDPALRALWWHAKGDWTRAHGEVDQEEDTRSAWAHAFLHREEGDLWNAGYWYRRAGRPPATGALRDEWAAIARALVESL